jgi:hypothetical protein
MLDKVGFQHRDSELRVINEKRPNDVINVDKYNRDDAIIYLSQKHADQEKVKE